MDIFSITFIIFIVSSFILFYLVGLINSLFKKIIIPQWFILLAASLFFYGFVNWIYLLYLAGSFAITYIISLVCQYSISKQINDNGKTIVSVNKYHI